MRSWPPGREKTTLQQTIYRHDMKHFTSAARVSAPLLVLLVIFVLVLSLSGCQLHLSLIPLSPSPIAFNQRDRSPTQECHRPWMVRSNPCSILDDLWFFDGFRATAREYAGMPLLLQQCEIFTRTADFPPAPRVMRRLTSPDFGASSNGLRQLWRQDVGLQKRRALMITQ